MRKFLLSVLFLTVSMPILPVGVFAEETLSSEDILFMEIPMVITASKTEEKLADAPGVISVITKDELERFGGTTLKDILERVPSLIGTTASMTDRSIISARGDQFKETSSHVLLLINGRPLREVLEGGIVSETLESFPVNIIERIEVIRGPGSVLYGSGAFSAVINIITEKAEKNDITVAGLAGEAGASNTMGKFKYLNGDFSMVVAGKYHQKPDWKAAYDYTDFTGTVGENKVNIPDKGPGSYFEINYKNLRFMSTYNQWQNSYFIPDFMAIFPSFGDVTWKKGFGNLGYSLTVNEKWNMDFNLTYTRSTFETSSWPDIKRDSYESIAEWTNFIVPTEKLRITLGGSYDSITGIEDTLIPGGTMRSNDSKRNSFALYTQMDYWLRQDKMKLIGGFQANKVENIDLDVVPRAGFILYPATDINVKVLYSKAFRAPTLNELYIDNPGILKGNPELKAEKVNTIDIGVNYNKGMNECGMNYFFSEQTDIIFQDMSLGLGGQFTYKNKGKLETQGVELEGKYYLSRRFFLTGSTLYQTNKDKEGNENVIPISNFGAKAGISYKSEKGTVSLFNNYQGELDKKFNTQLNPSPGAYNLMNLHCKLDMNKLAGWNFSRGLSLLLQVDNLLDKEIWLPNWGVIAGNSIPVNQGRTIYLGIEASL